MRPSPLSGGYSQQSFRPRGPVAPQWGSRGPQPAPFMGYDYQQRGPYPSQTPQYPPPSYGNYPPQAPRSSYGPSWDQRPPSAMHGPPQVGAYNFYAGQEAAEDQRFLQFLILILHPAMCANIFFREITTMVSHTVKTTVNQTLILRHLHRAMGRDTMK